MELHAHRQLDGEEANHLDLSCSIRSKSSLSCSFIRCSSFALRAAARLSRLRSILSSISIRRIFWGSMRVSERYGVCLKKNSAGGVCVYQRGMVFVSRRIVRSRLWWVETGDECAGVMCECE